MSIIADTKEAGPKKPAWNSNGIVRKQSPNVSNQEEAV